MKRVEDRALEARYIGNPTAMDHVKIPDGADVTANNYNKYERDRAQNAENKGDTSLHRFGDGKDATRRPDQFLSEKRGGDDVPWMIRPTDVFANPQISAQIKALSNQRKMATAMAGKKHKKQSKKKEKKDKK